MDTALFFEIHSDLPGEGPGRRLYTKKAFDMIPLLQQPRILDIGCGPGEQTITLAQLSDGEIIAIDIHQPYLDQLMERARQAHVDNRIQVRSLSMKSMDFPKEYFDIIWAEGSIYAMGFQNGLQAWKQFIRPQGYLAVHEMSWIQPNPPEEIANYWKKEYPGLTTIENNLSVIENCGYTLLDYFPLPDDAWWELYYRPLEQRLQELRKKYKNDPKALQVIHHEQEEIDLYRKYYHWYGSVFFVMQKQ